MSWGKQNKIKKGFTITKEILDALRKAAKIRRENVRKRTGWRNM